MLIWPFLALTGILLSLLAYAVFSIEKQVIINNWDKRRCDLPVMFGASYFKPSTDSRTDTEFAQENFSFCMKRRVTEIMETLMVPFMFIFKGQMGVAGSIGGGLNIVRNIFSKIYQAFLSFLRPFYQRYVAVAYQVMAITQHLKMAYQKINTIVLAFIYSGLTILRGMINVKDFIIKVVLIILGILVALVVILFFALAPFIGVIILPTIAAITAVAGGAAVGGMADAFCLAPETEISMEDGKICQISSLKMGDRLKRGGAVQAIIKTTGRNVVLYSISGILMSSYHILWDDDKKIWCFAKNHSRAIETSERRDRLWCIVTENRIFETSTGLIIRDWEELLDTDEDSNYEYEIIINYLLNNDVTRTTDISETAETANKVGTFGRLDDYFYKVNGQLISTKTTNQIHIDDIINDSYNSRTTIVGLTEFNCDFLWVKDNTSGLFYKLEQSGKKYTMPITGSGTIMLYDGLGIPVKTIMDYTEIGSVKLNKTYDFILSKLNSVGNRQ